MLERKGIDSGKKMTLSRKMPAKISNKSSLLKPSAALLITSGPSLGFGGINNQYGKITPLPKTPTGNLPTPRKPALIEAIVPRSPSVQNKHRNLTPSKPNISINSRIIQHIHIGKVKEGKEEQKEECLIDRSQTLLRENQALLLKIKELEKEKEQWKRQRVKAKTWLEQLVPSTEEELAKRLKKGIEELFPEEELYRSEVLERIDEVIEINENTDTELYQKFIEFKDAKKVIAMPTFMKSLAFFNENP